MKVKNSLIIFFSLFTLTVFSQDNLKLSAKVSRDTIGYFDVVRVTFEANSGDATLREPYFEDFTIYKDKSINIETSYTNNSKTSKTVISYVLKPKRTGELIIDRAVFEYNDKIFSTEPVTIYVKGETLTNNSLKKDDKIFVSAQISNYTPFCYEPVTIEYKLYYCDDFVPSSISFDFNKEYLDQFYIYSIVQEESASKDVVDGKEYNSIVIKKDVIRFKQQAEISLNNKMTIEYKTKKTAVGDDDIISEKFLSVDSKKIKAKKMEKTSNFPYEIQSFGDYRLEVFYPENTKIRKNEIIEINVQLDGEGYIEDEIIPKLTIPKTFEIVSSEIKNEPIFEGEKIKTVATRTYRIKPLAVGNYKFSPVRFNFYNEKKQQRKTVLSKGFTLTVN